MMATLQEKQFVFFYKYKIGQKQTRTEIYADNEREAVLKLLDQVGVCLFSCITESKKIFTEKKYPKAIEQIKNGC